MPLYYDDYFSYLLQAADEGEIVSHPGSTTLPVRSTK